MWYLPPGSRHCRCA
ncbi:hypothetical protein DYI26_13330 [Halomonas litopenaei]|nr:hypothetical protein [Halomonas litopenaei]